MVKILLINGVNIDRQPVQLPGFLIMLTFLDRLLFRYMWEEGVVGCCLGGRGGCRTLKCALSGRQGEGLLGLLLLYIY